MASYQDYGYEPDGFERRSPRGSVSRQNLGFLDGFGDSSEDDQMDYKHEQEKLVYRRGITYTVILSVVWILYIRHWKGNFVIGILGISFVWLIEDVRAALTAVWWPPFTPSVTALERRPSSVPSDFTPARSVSVARNRSPRNVAGAAAFTGRNDRFRGKHPDNQPRRLWNESLQDAWPHVRDDIIEYLYRIPYIVRDMWMAHIVFQILITLMQTLGVHFREGQDTIGVFPRAYANLTSTQNLFGVGGLAGVLRSYASIARWGWHSIVGSASKIWGFLLSSTSIPGEFPSAEQLTESSVKSFYQTAGVTSPGVHQ